MARKKEEIYAKKKLFYRYVDDIKLLDDKIEHYQKMISNFDKIINNGDSTTL